VWVTAGKTAVLPYTIWLPKIDTARAVKIDSPTKSESIVTTPLIPGLELRIPAGAVITDKDGRVAREISITPIPVDQPPFPLPDGVDVPIYFTIQPGGASVAVPGSSGYQRGARLNYPNYGQRQPGAPAEFWQYEPEDGRGWYVYGRGAVTADGCQVAPNPGVSIHAFTGAMFGPPAFGGGPGEAPGDHPGYGGDPVHLGTGVSSLLNPPLRTPATPLAVCGARGLATRRTPGTHLSRRAGACNADATRGAPTIVHTLARHVGSWKLCMRRDNVIGWRSRP
jgi:hypothetical protein